MTIGKLTSESGVPASTIRYWQRVDVLPRPASRISRQRRYSTDAVEYLAVLRLAEACGFRLDECRLAARLPTQRQRIYGKWWKNLALRKQ